LKLLKIFDILSFTFVMNGNRFHINILQLNKHLSLLTTNGHQQLRMAVRFRHSTVAPRYRAP